MTEFAIGRVGLAVADGGDDYELEHPFAWQQQGRVVQLQGIQKEFTRPRLVALVDRINGLDPSNNLDETSLPVYSATVPELNGYFAVVSAGATITSGSNVDAAGTGFVTWQVTLARQAVWRRPVIEVPMVMDLLTNSWGLTTSSATEATPGTPINWVTAGASGSGTRSTERGSVNYAYIDSASWGTTIVRTARYVASMQEFYRGCAYVEDAGTHQLTLVGRADYADPSALRIGNGIVRMTCAAASSTFTFQWWNGASWVAGRAFQVGWGTVGLTPVSVVMNATIIKNAADECIVRYFGVGNTVTFGDTRNVSFDVSIRRGERVVRIFMDAGSSLGSWIAASSAMASTSKGYGLRSTSTINSEYVVLTSNNATTRDLVNGSLSGAGGPPTMFGIGVSSGGGTGTGINDADGIASTLFLAQSSTQRVVVA